MKNLLKLFCAHRVSVDKLRRVAPDRVECPCNRCGKVLSAEYGIALNARWEAAPPLNEWPLQSQGREVPTAHSLNSEARPQCWCADCNPGEIRMFVCPSCGCKRCPRASTHEQECTGQTGAEVPGGHTCSGCLENRAQLDAAVRQRLGGGSHYVDAACPQGAAARLEARPEGALASSGPDEPTPDSAEHVSVELRQRMGRE